MRYKNAPVFAGILLSLFAGSASLFAFSAFEFASPAATGTLTSFIKAQSEVIHEEQKEIKRQIELADQNMTELNRMKRSADPVLSGHK